MRIGEILSSCTYQFYFPVENNKRIVHALQSGLKSELTWALNTLTLLSFKEKDDIRKDSNNALAKISGLLDALLTIVCLAVLEFYHCHLFVCQTIIALSCSANIY